MEAIEQALSLKAELDSLRPISQEQESRIMQKFRLDWNYHSNRIEGNSLSFGETKALILFGITAQGKPLKDHFEITGHDEAIKWITDVVKEEYPLTENFIRQLHVLLLKESYEVDAITPDGKPTKRKIAVGTYKTAPNHVLTKTGEIFRFATPEETPAKMYDLINWYREKKESPDTNPIILAAEFHYRFIRIHPFDDGNGRTARILMNFILMQYAFPPVIIKTEDKENYFAALRQADAGILEPFINYISENLLRSMQIMIAGAKGESIEEPDDVEKELALLEQRLKNASSKIPKTKESILFIFDNVCVNLFKQFINDFGRFERFYNYNEVYIELDGYMRDGKTEIILSEIRNKINSESSNLNFQYNFFSIKYKSHEARNFQSNIKICFDFNKYRLVSVETGKSVESGYESILSENDIKKVLKAEAARHKEFIEKMIKEIEDGRTD